VRVAVKGVNGVDSVQVSLNRGMATIELKDGNTVTMKQLRDAIAKNGFTTRQSEVVALGQLSSKDGKLLLRVTGSEENYELAPASGAGVDQSLVGKMVSVAGTVPESALQIRFRSITERK
jgi:copper chaperone CopZ